jgi:multicomponent Na+:H+ antiporter subunit D
MLSGVVTAASQMDIRRILSFHIISQVGYMILGLAVLTPLALAAALIYMVHNIIAKATLFLVGGLIQRAGGSFHLTQIGSLYKTHGLLSAGFFIPAFALAGFPPLSGFWAKLLIIYACLESRHYGAAALAAFVGLLTLFSMVKIWMEAFWKPAPQNQTASETRTLPPWMMGPVLGLCLMIVLMGIFIEPVFHLALTAGEQLVDPAAYVAAVTGGK